MKVLGSMEVGPVHHGLMSWTTLTCHLLDYEPPFNSKICHHRIKYIDVC